MKAEIRFYPAMPKIWTELFETCADLNPCSTRRINPKPPAKTSSEYLFRLHFQ